MKKIGILFALILLSSAIFAQTRTMLGEKVSINGYVATLSYLYGTVDNNLGFRVDMNAAWHMPMQFTSVSDTNGYVHLEVADTITIGGTKVLQWFPAPIDSIKINAASVACSFEGFYWTALYMRPYYRNTHSTTATWKITLLYSRKM
jgi:hypothetical protein